jgi:hypothetical protein
MCIRLSKQQGCLLASFVDLFVYIPHSEEEEEKQNLRGFMHNTLGICA